MLEDREILMLKLTWIDVDVPHEPAGLKGADWDGGDVEGAVALADLLEDVGVCGVTAEPEPGKILYM